MCGSQQAYATFVCPDRVVILVTPATLFILFFIRRRKKKKSSKCNFIYIIQMKIPSLRG
jgi:hypothetical protein